MASLGVSVQGYIIGLLSNDAWLDPKFVISDKRWYTSSVFWRLLNVLGPWAQIHARRL